MATCIGIMSGARFCVSCILGFVNNYLRPETVNEIIISVVY